MTQTVARILSEAEQLSVAEREELADRLVESLVLNNPPEVQQAQVAQVRRRIADVESGEVSLVSSRRPCNRCVGWSAQLQPSRGKDIVCEVKLQDIEQEALGLTEGERAELVLSLMRTLAAPGADIADEEVFRRDAELDTGSVEPMVHEEFVRRVREERGQ